MLGISLGIGIGGLGPLGACSAEPADTITSGGGGLGLNVDGGPGLTPDSACALFEEQAISKPVNLYIMFDKSSSMAGNKWDNAKAGLSAFVDDDKSAGLALALRFFPREVDATPACEQSAYQEPTVPFGALPGNAAAIKAAMDAEQPNGFSTPMYPALGGALLKGIEMAKNNPGEVSAVLLVTDGQAQGPAETCGGVDPEDPTQIAALAATGANYTPPVATYVVGLPGVDQSSANLIAAAGGTDSAILTGSNDVQTAFRDALGKVRGDVLPCVYEIPDKVTSGEVTIGQVNVEVTPDAADGEPYLLPYNPGCSGAGWQYDNASEPSEIRLCDSSCQALKELAGAGIQILLGCDSVLD